MNRKNSTRKIMILIAGAGLLVLVGLVGLIRPVRQATQSLLSPITNPLTKFSNNSANFFGALGSLSHLTSDNNALKTQVADLKAQLASAKEADTKNQILNSELALDQSAGRKLLPAAVINYEPDNFRQYLTINRGQSQGVGVGMAVVAQGSLIGKIDSVDATSAKVFLISDPNFRINGIDQSTRTTGTVRGQIGAGLVMDQVPQSDALTTKDLIITSGLGGVVPSGLLIGTVESVDSTSNSVFKTAHVVSAVQFSRLEVVMVILKP